MSDRFIETCVRMMPPGAVDEAADPPVFSPPTAALMADMVRLAAERHASVAVTGGGTHPQPVPREGMVILSTRGVTGQAVIDTDDFIADLAAGTTVDEAIVVAAAAGMEFPLDVFSGADATVGGALMTRATGGARRIGATFADAVLGGCFVVAPGEIVTAGGRTIKNVTGYDLTRFFAGSLGMFGVVVRVIVKLTALPESTAVLVMRFPAGGDAIDGMESLLTATAPDTIEVCAPGGLDCETLVCARYSGFTGIVNAACDRAAAAVQEYRGVSVETTTEETSRMMLRNTVMTAFGDGTVAAAISPAATGAALKGIWACCPHMPVACHARDGRLWFLPGGDDGHRGYTAAITSIGGKRPVSWHAMREQGVAGLFTDAERGIVRSLKRELDPTGIFNRHLTP